MQYATKDFRSLISTRGNNPNVGNHEFVTVESRVLVIVCGFGLICGWVIVDWRNIPGLLCCSGYVFIPFEQEKTRDLRVNFRFSFGINYIPLWISPILNLEVRHFFALVVLLVGHLSFSQTRQGVLDLRNWDPQEPMLLSGEYEFYWNTLADSAEELDSLDYMLVAFPALWSDLELAGEKLPPFGFATYRLKLLLPTGTSKFSALVEDMYCAYALYADGQLVAKNGKVGRTMQEHQPFWQPKKVDFNAASDTLELILQISNFEHSKGGALEPMVFGSEPVISRLSRNQQAYDLLLTGCLIMGGLFFLGLYLFGRHQASILYFSLFCITYSYRIIGSGHYVLHSLIDGYPWWIAIRLEYISLFASVLLFAQFLIRLYPLDTSQRFVRFVSIICWLCMMSTIVLPLFYFSQIVTPFFLFLLAAFSYTVRVYVTAWKRKRPGGLYALLSIAIALFIFSYNILSYFQLLDASDRVSFWGYISFFFSQSLLLSHQFAYSFKELLRKAQLANEAKTDFLATISHEIRTPLNAIVGMAHLTLRSNPRQDQIRNLESLTFSAENLTSLINDILDFNKIDSGSLKLERLPVNLREHAEKIVKGYEGQSILKNIPIYLDVDERIYHHFLADPVRIAQVFNNLINNALKFTAEGRIDVEIEVLQDNSDSQILDVRIKDTGPGIHKDHMELIFDRFTQASTSTTREFGGTGLGLSIVRGILNLYGSQIKVTSTLGQGSVFSFEIKLEKAKTADIRTKRKEMDKEPIETNPENLEGKRVLIVEDNLMNMVIAEEFLSRWGMELDKATNGQEAVDKTQDNDYALILMDLHMPVMDGYEASKAIKAMKPDIPILALTASTVAEQELQITEAGMEGFVLKPFHPKDLKAKLLQVLSDS